MRGKTTCETLKAIRKQVADANGIPYEPHVCTYKGPCSGTCPACEAEARYIEAELAKRQKAKQPVNIVGVAKDKMPEPSSFKQAVAAAATITAVMTFTALPVDAVAQTNQTSKTEKTDMFRVKGVVKDDMGTLPGASIMIKGTDRGTEADDNGEFSLDVTVGDTLVVEYLGYDPKEVAVTKNLKKLTIKFDYTAEPVQELAGLIAMPTPVMMGACTVFSYSPLPAYASVEKTDISNINKGEGLLNNMQNVSEIPSSGQPGSNLSLQIGGISTLIGHNSPLYVVDGMPVSSGVGVDASLNPLASINPSDVESIDFSNKRSLLCLYGGRASNGVVYIETKKDYWYWGGTKTKIKYNGSFSISQFTKRYSMMNLNDYNAYAGNTQIANDRASIYDGNKANLNIQGEETDWQDALFRTGYSQNHYLSVYGNSDNTEYNFSLGYTNTEGVVQSTSYERITGRASVESQVKRYIRMGMNLGVTHQKMEHAAGVSDYSLQRSNASIASLRPTEGNLFLQTLQTLPSASSADGSNAVTRQKQSPIERTELNVLGNSFLEFRLYNDVKWRNELGVDMTSANDRQFLQSYAGSEASLDEGDYSNSMVQFHSCFSYNHVFGKYHDLALLAGAETEHYNWEGQLVNGTGFASNAVGTLNMASTTSVIDCYQGSGSMAGTFARASYDYRRKLGLVASGRYDGSYNFISGNQWHFYPAANAYWSVSDEDFIYENEMLSKTITDLKVMAGYGKTGNANLVPLTANDIYTGNKAYDWESNKMFDVELDLSLWNRIDVSAKAFVKKNDDLLLCSTAPDGSLVYSNDGGIKNTGFGINLHTINIEDSLLHQPFSWYMDLTFNRVRNEVTSLGVAVDGVSEKSDPLGAYTIAPAGAEINRTVVNEAPGRFYGYKAGGIIKNEAELTAYQQATGRTARVGDMRYSAEKSFIGDPNPDFTYGFATDIKWGPWSLNIMLVGSQGNDVYNLMRQRLEMQTDVNANLPTSCANFARVVTDASGSHVENATTSMPRSDYGNATNGSAGYVSDRYVEDGSYLRLQNISVTYTLPYRYYRRMKIDNLHVGVGVSNLYTFTKYSGYDPAISGSALRQGVDDGRYPSPRNYNLSVGFSF